MPRKKTSGQDETFLQFVIDVLINSVVIVLLFFFIQWVIVAPFKVVGSSMVDTLQNGEFILISKIEYLLGHPERGDIVVFHPPEQPEEYYIKRIIGIPGDVVELKAGKVIVNGQALEEDYLRSGTITCRAATARQCDTDNERYEVPPGRYFVLGDNRRGSSDSRAWERSSDDPLAPFVDEEEIQGKTRFVVYPLPVIRWLEETDVFASVSSG